MALGRSASLKIDWTRLQSQLGLKGTTATSLAAFKKRNDDARRKVTMLTEQPQSVDFEHYRSILSNKAIVDEIEKQVKPFKPATYDVNRQLKAIDAFEATALKSAQDTKAVVDQELRDLNKTLTNIETARPVTDLTVDEIATAAPEVTRRTEQMVSKGKWMPRGYREKFGDLSVL